MFPSLIPLLLHFNACVFYIILVPGLAFQVLTSKLLNELNYYYSKTLSTVGEFNNNEFLHNLTSRTVFGTGAK
jgi:hypothetical protein